MADLIAFVWALKQVAVLMENEMNGLHVLQEFNYVFQAEESWRISEAAWRMQRRPADSITAVLCTW